MTSTSDYLERVRQADPSAVGPWQTDVCPECDESITSEDFVAAAHVVIRGSVVLGCEGYWVVSPAAVGMDAGDWQDWRDD